MDAGAHGIVVPMINSVDDGLAFGREADRITSSGAMVVRFARTAANLIRSRIRPGRIDIAPPAEPRIEDRRAAPIQNSDTADD